MHNGQCVVIPLDKMEVIAERPSLIVSLLLLSIRQGGHRLIKTTYDELAYMSGYANRSGAWKQMNKLERAGLIIKGGRGEFVINLDWVYKSYD
jgi:hypothetical protein